MAFFSGKLSHGGFDCSVVLAQQKKWREKVVRPITFYHLKSWYVLHGVMRELYMRETGPRIKFVARR